MRCVDVNVLIAAHRPDAPDHDAYREALTSWAADDDEPLGLPDVVLSGWIRISTNHRIFPDATPTARVWEQVDELLTARASRLLRPGPSHFAHFQRLSMQIDAKGNDVTDAYIAAYAVETNATLISADRGFRRFDGVRYQHPLA